MFRITASGVRDYLEVEKEAKVTGRVCDITDTDSGIRITIGNVNVIKGTPVKRDENLLVSIYSDDNLRIGNIITVSGKAKAFEPAGNPGQFNAYSYYRGKGYVYKISAGEYEITDHSFDRYREFIRDIATSVKESFFRYLPEKDAGMISAMVLGDRSFLDENDKELYKQDGIMHILAVSALHVSMISVIVLWIISKFPVGFVTGRISVITVLIIYGSIAGFSVSCTRAVVMLLSGIVAGLTGNSYDRLSAMSLAGIIILLADPAALFRPDYQLSFGASSSIMIVSGITDRIEYKSDIIKMICNSFFVSLGVTLFTMPVLLYNYYDVPLYSVLINLIVIPLMTLLFVAAVLCGLAGITGGLADVFGDVYDGIVGLADMFAEFMAGTVHFILEFYRWICEMAADLCYEFRITGCPDMKMIVLYYILLGLMILTLRKLLEDGEDSRLYRMIHAITHKCTVRTQCTIITMCFLVVLTAVISHKFGNDSFLATVLDVGQGDGIYMELPDSSTMFIDGGSSDVSLVGRYRLMPYLMYKGTRKIDRWVITHGDSDHYSGFMEILDQVVQGKFRIGELWLADVSNPGDGYREVEDKAKEAGINVVKVSSGMRWQWGDAKEAEVNLSEENSEKCLENHYTKSSEFSITCLNPEKNYTCSGENEYSVVLLVRCGSFSGLFTGDVESSGEEKLTEYFKNDPIDLTMLKVAHHGSHNSSPEELIGLLHPDIAVISCGKNNRYGHPHEEILDRLRRIKADIFRTDINGAVTVNNDGEIDIYMNQ